MSQLQTFNDSQDCNHDHERKPPLNLDPKLFTKSQSQLQSRQVSNKINKNDNGHDNNSKFEFNKNSLASYSNPIDFPQTPLKPDDEYSSPCHHRGPSLSTVSNYSADSIDGLHYPNAIDSYIWSPESSPELDDDDDDDVTHSIPGIGIPHPTDINHADSNEGLDSDSESECPSPTAPAPDDNTEESKQEFIEPILSENKQHSNHRTMHIKVSLKPPSLPQSRSISPLPLIVANVEYDNVKPNEEGDDDTKIDEDEVHVPSVTNYYAQDSIESDEIVEFEEYCSCLPNYQWQQPILNEEHYTGFHSNFQKEVMNNPFYDLTAQDFNDTLKKCRFIKSRWLGDKIRSNRNGSLYNCSWKAGEKITELDLFVFKLYTDFEDSQRELKKCYRLPTKSGQILQYEQRLCHFSHWRRKLNVAIKKYGTLLKNRTFYHG
eukprot:141608_1